MHNEQPIPWFFVQDATDEKSKWYTTTYVLELLPIPKPTSTSNNSAITGSSSLRALAGATSTAKRNDTTPTAAKDKTKSRSPRKRILSTVAIDTSSSKHKTLKTTHNTDRKKV